MTVRERPEGLALQYSREMLLLDRLTGIRFATILSAHRVGPVRCDCWKVAYISAGSAALSVRGEVTHHVKSGDLVVIRRGTTYSLDPVVPTAATVLYVDSAMLDSRFSWLLSRQPFIHAIRGLINEEAPVCVLRPSVELSAHVGHVFTSAASAHPYSEHQLDTDTALRDIARLLDVLDIVRMLALPGPEKSNAETPPRPPSPTRSEVLRATEMLHGSLHENWSRRRLADAVRLSPSHLAALFRAELGAPPMMYLAELRLQRMSYLLATTRDSVAEVSSRSGWQDPAYAAKLFRRRFGVSPSEFRQTKLPL